MERTFSPQICHKLELLKLGENIRGMRKSLELSQEALAGICDLHRTYVCDVERGARHVSFSTLLKLAHGLDTTVPELTRNVESDSHFETGNDSRG